MAEERQDKPRKSAAAFVFPPSAVRSLLRSRSADENQLRLPRLIQPPGSNPCPITMLNTLRELDFNRILVSFPSLMARVRLFTVPLPTQVSSIRFHVASPAACISTVNFTSEDLCATPPLCSTPPLADGTCPTVHHSTTNSGIANPDLCTLPRAPSVYQRRTVRWRSSTLL